MIPFMNIITVPVPKLCELYVCHGARCHLDMKTGEAATNDYIFKAALLDTVRQLVLVMP